MDGGYSRQVMRQFVKLKPHPPDPHAAQVASKSSGTQRRESLENSRQTVPAQQVALVVHSLPQHSGVAHDAVHAS